MIYLNTTRFDLTCNVSFIKIDSYNFNVNFICQRESFPTVQIRKIKFKTQEHENLLTLFMRHEG